MKHKRLLRKYKNKSGKFKKSITIPLECLEYLKNYGILLPNRRA